MVKSVNFQALLLVMALVLLSIQSVGAQYNPRGTNTQSSNQRRTPTKPWGQAPSRTAAPPEFDAVRLDRDVALPSLPSYPGKQIFLNGLQYPNAKGGPGYMVVYNTEHTKEQVKDWWTNALKGDPWKIEFQSATMVKALTKDGSKCTISVAARSSSTADKMKGMRGSYTIYYQHKPPKQ